MSTKKNIDRLFQEKFKDFEAIPQEKLWKNIKTELEITQKSNVVPIPLWYKIAAAAIIAISIGIGNLLYTSDTPPILMTTTEECIEENSTPYSIIPNHKNTVTQIPKHEKYPETGNTHTAHEISQKKSYSNNIFTTTKNGNTTPDENINSKKTASFVDNQKLTPQFLKEKNMLQAEDSIIKPETTIATHQENALQHPFKKSIFDTISTKKKNEKTERNIQRWNITPIIAPIYSTIGNRSTINNQLDENTKNGLDFSYGIQISYAINKKVSVRYGVHKIDINHTTENSELTPTTLNAIVANTEVNTTEIVSLLEPESPTVGINSNPQSQTTNSGTIIYEINYLEVPLEIKYAITPYTSKFQVHLIGGMSTLFLSDNTITIQSEDPRIGTLTKTSNTLNSMSFSGNIGVGLNYKMTKQLHLTLEPMLKYQFNVFSKDAERFTPYYFGMYTGLNFRF